MLLLLIIKLFLQYKLIETKAEDIASLAGYATKGQFPYMIALFLNGNFKCGGSIISENYIVTSAHCLHNRNPLNMTVALGAINITTGSGIIHNLKKFIIHPKFNSINQDFDIGLIQVEKSMKLGTPTVNSIKLTDVNKDYPANTTATIIGYAIKVGGADKVKKLKYANVPMWSRDECNYVIRPAIQDHMICAGRLLGKIGSCPGDSGGPLVIDDKLFGVTAFGFGCGTHHPTVYIRVPSFRSWIMKNAGLK